MKLGGNVKKPMASRPRWAVVDFRGAVCYIPAPTATAQVGNFTVGLGHSELRAQLIAYRRTIQTEWKGSLWNPVPDRGSLPKSGVTLYSSVVARPATSVSMTTKYRGSMQW